MTFQWSLALFLQLLSQLINLHTVMLYLMLFCLAAVCLKMTGSLNLLDCNQLKISLNKYTTIRLMFICTLHTAEATFMANFVVFSTTSVVLSLLSGSHTGSAPDWCALQEALWKCSDTIQYRIVRLCMNLISLA